MTDLNLTYGTLSDGGGSRPFSNPQYANDNTVSNATTEPFVHVAATYTARLKTDLAATRLVQSMIVYGNIGGWNPDPGWAVWHSDDGTNWTLITPDSYVWDVSDHPQGYIFDTGSATITFAATAARYWRIGWSATYAGLGYTSSSQVAEWVIPEADPVTEPTASETRRIYIVG